jgi:hypothetical protein
MKPAPFALLLASTISLSIVAAEKAPAPDPKTLPAPQRIVVPKLSGTLKIDGDLTEAVWAKAAVLKPFVLNDGSKPGREGTEVRVWYDDTAFYMGWVCTDADIQATFKERDSKFWEEEVAEFFITSKDLSKYYELQWNPLGGVFDAVINNQLDDIGRSKKMAGEWGFTAKGMKSAVKVKGTVANSADKDEYWRVEVMVPFADLGESAPKPGDVWRGNFYRFNREKDKSAELLAWSPTLYPSFHQPSRFGFLEFGK